ncbi:MAG TPA: hypothetical protein VKX46_02085 [Ktedonobacteraceae bacterium]|nr:hypothetical protein [Ktedonobacteraceae bacterium]
MQSDRPTKIRLFGALGSIFPLMFCLMLIFEHRVSGVLLIIDICLSVALGIIYVLAMPLLFLVFIKKYKKDAVIYLFGSLSGIITSIIQLFLILRHSYSGLSLIISLYIVIFFSIFSVFNLAMYFIAKYKTRR